MALGFQSGAFQSPGFQQVQASVPAVGGVTHGRRGRVSWFARVLHVRDLDDEDEVERAIERAIVKPAPKQKRRRAVRREPGGLQPPLAPVVVEAVDWDVVDRIRRAATVESMPDIVAILDRVIRRMREDDERDDEEALVWLM